MAPLLGDAGCIVLFCFNFRCVAFSALRVTSTVMEGIVCYYSSHTARCDWGGSHFCRIMFTWFDLHCFFKEMPFFLHSFSLSQTSTVRCLSCKGALITLYLEAPFT